MSGAASLPSGEPVVLAAQELRHLPRSVEGYDTAAVDEAFDAFRRQIAALQAEIYELRTESHSAADGFSAEAARAEALRVVNAAAELAQAMEHDARETAARQLATVEQELAARRSELDEREAVVEEERRRILEAAEEQARAQVAEAERRATEAIAAAGERAEELVAQARSEADELRATTRHDAVPAEQEVDREGPRKEAAEPVRDAPEPASAVLAPPLSPEDLAATSPPTFRLDV